MTAMADQEHPVNHDVPPDIYSVLHTAADEAASGLDCQRFDAAIDTLASTGYRLGMAGGLAEAARLLRDLPAEASLSDAARLLDEHAESWRQVALGGLGPEAHDAAERLTS